MRDSQFVFNADTVEGATAFVHPLMVLGFDVYFDPVERTVPRLGRDTTRTSDIRFNKEALHDAMTPRCAVAQANNVAS